jgi:hypothetical protein
MLRLAMLRRVTVAAAAIASLLWSAPAASASQAAKPDPKAPAKPEPKPDPKGAAKPESKPEPKAEDKTPPAPDLLSIAKDVGDSDTASALGWLAFAAAGYKNPADLLGHGPASDAELALGDAVERAVKPLFESLPGKKGKVKLNDAVEGTITKLEDGGLVVNVNKNDTLVTWGEIDPGKVAALLLKNKPTAEPDVAAIATLKLLGGDLGDAKTKATKLTSELGKKLGEISTAWKTVGPEWKAARALDSALRDKDAAKGLEKFKACWADAKASKLGSELAPKLREEFVLRGEKAYAGDVALKLAIHGKATVNPSKASPEAGPGGVGLEVEYEFEKSSEGADFDPDAKNAALLNILRNVEKKDVKPEGFIVSQSRLTPLNACGGPLPLEFAGDMEIEVQGGLSEQIRSEKTGYCGVGFVAPNGKSVLLFGNFTHLESVVDGKPGATSTNPLKDLHPGTAVIATIHVGKTKVTTMRDGKELEPALEVAFSGPMQPFVVMANDCQWFVERMVVRGTATRASLEGLAHKVAAAEAKTLFGGE